MTVATRLARPPAAARAPRNRAGEPGGDGRMPVSKFHVPEIVFGPGSLAEAGHAARRLGAQRAFVVTDPGIVEAGWVAELHRHLAAAGVRFVTWHDVTPNPKDHEVARGYDAYRASGCDVVVGIGGGSAMDAAKAVAVLAANGGVIGDYAGVDKVGRAIPPLVMLPTTAGTGADISQFCVVTDTARKVKATLLGRALVPNISLTDPRVLVTMPEWLSAASGIDALTHAIEAYLSRAANSLTDVCALSAMRLISTHLVRTVVDPRDAAAREAMATGSLQAGMAFTNSLLGATHALSHALGGLLDLPHGVINGVMLPHVLRFNAVAAADRCVAVAQALGAPGAAGPGAAGMPGAEAAEAVAEQVRLLADDLGIPRRLADLGVRPADIPALAAAAVEDCCIATNPRDVTPADLAEVLHAAL